MENSHDAHAICFTINGTEECSTLPPLLTSIKSHYVPNETIQLVGVFRPNAMIQIDLVDPNDNIKNSALVQSDSSGSFQSKMVVPNDAVNGTWKINTSSGLNHSTLYITVISKNLQDNQTNPNHSNPTNFSQYPMTPLQQFKSGILAKDVKCKEGLQLVIKTEDGSPACVKSETKIKLIERGWAKYHTGVGALGYPPVQLFNVTTTPQPIVLGIPFYVNVAVSNHQSDPITFYGGCVSPLSVTFDNIKTSTNDVHCLAISKNVLGPNEQVVVHSERIETLYNTTGSNSTIATIKFSYEVNGNQTSFFISKQFSIQHEQALPEKSREANQTDSTLRLYLSTDSTYANPAEAVGVDISLNNTSSTPLILTKADNWPRNDLSSGPCSNLPFGMAIIKGYYTEQNMTGASSLVIYQNIPCPNPASIKSYTFQPLSSKATQECDSLFSCPVLADMKIHLKVDGFMDNNGQHRPFNVGTYTIVGGDEWGHVAIQHFTEAYATALAGVK